MIKGIGIDAVEVSRFDDWHLKPKDQLKKLFLDAEIEYCLANPATSAERFAVRFAAKEACFKALQAMQPNQKLSLPLISKEIEISKNGLGLPHLQFHGSLEHLNSLNAHLSLTHTGLMALAFVTLEQV